jgi:acyl transferase domain-containing protein/acyl carrier protein
MNVPVAIVGIGCRYPGGADEPGSFWRLLREGRSAVGDIPRDRMDVERWFDPRPATPGRMRSRWGGYLDRIDELDAAFFGISPREAERLDPQQRLLLETAWEALEDAGQDARRLEGASVGVYVGQWVSDFEARLFARPEELDFFMTTGSGRYAASGRLSFVLGLRGPSVTLDTACSSSLVAVHLAVQALRSGECPLALAGGVNVILQPHVSLAYSRSGMLAADGRCKFGDASGDGYVRSEGAGLVVLKPLAQALADGDRVYAVVRGSAVANDGRSSGSLGTPSREGQEALLRAAHRDAGVEGSRVGYVEAHGTGTRTGDPVELSALAAALSPGRAPGRRAWVGSVKTNLGHTEGAAGVAGLIKAALALHHREIPPSLHLREPNPAVPWAGAPFAIPTALTPWPDGDGPRLAGVSAFGIAGTNAHVVLEEAPPRPPRPAPAPERPVSLLPLSARSPEALRALAARWADRVDVPGAALPALCAAAATRRTPLEQRAAFVAEGGEALAAQLRGYAAGAPAPAEGVAAGRLRVAFVFPGQGGQWAGMARELLDREPAFREALLAADRAAAPLTGWSIAERLRAPADAPGQADIDVVQPVLLAVCMAHAALWRAMGIEPAAVVGHSMGEIAAAWLAGALGLDQAMRIVCRRSALMRRVAGRGAMALVDLGREAAQARLRGREALLSVAVCNAPRQSVISGEPAAVDAVLAELEREGVFCRRVKVDVASHSPQMEPLAAELAGELRGLAPGAAALPLYSTVLARRVEGAELGAEHWGRNLRQPVLFAQTLAAMLADGITAFVEVGPHPVLLPSVEQAAQAAGTPAVTVASGRREEPEQATFLAGLGKLWAAGVEVDWGRLGLSASAGLPDGAPLPLYPWQRERHWIEGAELDASAGTESAAAERPSAEERAWLHRAVWEEAAPGAAGSTGRWLVAAADAGAGAALAQALAAAGCEARAVGSDALEDALRSPSGSPESVAILAGAGEGVSYLPVRALQAMLAAGRPVGRLWLVTRGAQAAGDPAARVDVEQAALWGAARVVAEEHPDRWGGLVDLDPASAFPADAPPLARHLLAAAGEEQVALRGGRRLGLRLAPVDPGVRPAPFAWRKDAAYLVTGGLGDLGLHVARAMVAGGARRVILLGRTPLPGRDAWAGVDPGTQAGRRIAAVRALEAAGAAVHLAQVDVGHEEQLRAFLARWSAEGWPPIRGVVHAAAALHNGLASTMDRATFEACLRPKLRGAQLLDRLLPELDLFVVFSSVVAVLAQTGEANYAAANAGLDALAQDRKARGQRALSIAWGVWQETGFARGEAGERVARELGRQGIHGFSPERGRALFDFLRGWPTAHVAVLPIDWAAFRRARQGRGSALYQRLAGGSGPGPERPGGAPAGVGDARRAVEAAVIDAVAQVLKLAPGRIERSRALGSLGLTSLLAMELRNRLEAALGRSLPASLAFNYPTVAALVEHLAGEGDPAPIAPRPQEVAPVAPRQAVAEIAALSDEDAMRALQAGRPRGGGR